MSVLFEAAEIKGLTLRNRFVRSATYDGLAERNGLTTMCVGWGQGYSILWENLRRS